VRYEAGGEDALVARLRGLMLERQEASMIELALIGGPKRARALLEKAKPTFCRHKIFLYHLGEEGKLWASSKPMGRSLFKLLDGWRSLPQAEGSPIVGAVPVFVPAVEPEVQFSGAQVFVIAATLLAALVYTETGAVEALLALGVPLAFLVVRLVMAVRRREAVHERATDIGLWVMGGPLVVAYLVYQRDAAFEVKFFVGIVVMVPLCLVGMLVRASIARWGA